MKTYKLIKDADFHTEATENKGLVKGIVIKGTKVVCGESFDIYPKVKCVVIEGKFQGMEIILDYFEMEIVRNVPFIKLLENKKSSQCNCCGEYVSRELKIGRQQIISGSTQVTVVMMCDKCLGLLRDALDMEEK